MAVVGIDIGSQNTKAVILEGDEILGGASLETGESGESEARQAMEEALRQAGLKLEDMKSVVSTGAGRMNVPLCPEAALDRELPCQGGLFSLSPGPDGARCGGR
jgi:activator of 2-hydroxyglutaryl-CoA dehydratase